MSAPARPMTPRVLVTRRLTFSAAHRLHNPAWPEARNREVFGLCNNPNGHGHNYVLEVTVSGPVDPETGYVVDLKALRDAVETGLIGHLDHKHLNHDVHFLGGVNPTVENMVVIFWEVLAGWVEPLGVRLHRLRLHETENNVAEYSGELM